MTEISTDINNILLRLPYKMTEWILSLDINSVEKIHSIQRLFDSDDYHVITFNYTKVLEKIYEIDKSKVTHIHGIADDKNSKIILGHSQVNKKSSVSSNGDYRIDEAIQLFNMYYKKTRKPTEEVIQDNIELFYKLNKLKEVIIIGHSMSDVDIPYYKKMIENIDINEVKWKVYHHHTQSSHFFIETLSKLGVNEENIKTVNINVLRNIPSSKHDG